MLARSSASCSPMPLVKTIMIQPAQRHTLGRQRFGGAVAKQRHRQPGVGVAAGSGMHAAQVAAEAGDAQQATLLVDQALQTVGVQRQAAHQIGQHTRVQVTATAAHHQPAAECQAHAGVHRHTIQHRRDTGPVAQVGNQQTAWQRRAKLLHDGFTRQAMKAVTLDALRTPRVGQRQHTGHLGQAGLEAGVQTHHLRQQRVLLQCGLDQGQRGGCVQWCEWRGRRQLLQHRQADAHVLAQLRATMHHPVAGGRWPMACGAGSCKVPSSAPMRRSRAGGLVGLVGL